MPDTTTFSIVALVVSVASFGLSSYLVWRDRSQLKTKCYAREHERTGEYLSVITDSAGAGNRHKIEIATPTFNSSAKASILTGCEHMANPVSIPFASLSGRYAMKPRSVGHLYVGRQQIESAKPS